MSTPLAAPHGTAPDRAAAASAPLDDYDRIADVFRPIIDRIAADAVEREELRLLPFEEVGWLKEAGFGALRVPVEYGGWGVSLTDLVRLLIEIAAADSNVPQLLRGHVAFVETQRALPDTPQRREWFERIADRRILFGNAQAERSGTSATSTTLEQRDGRLVLNGRKYYSTGTLFADWIWSAARWDDAPVALAVPARAEGVTRIDDWDGFGQRLTGSGTTVFEDVLVDPAHVLPFEESAEHRPLAYTSGLYQLVLLASLAGIARAAEREAVAFVRPRTRTFGVAGESTPRADPLVQAVVGRVASARFAAESIVLEAARRLEQADDARRADDSDAARYDAALVAVFEAQQTVIDLVLRATTELFEVGGASATSTTLRLDRLWRNARTIASHNPAIQRAAQIGAYHLDGTPPPAGPPRAPRG